jgi:hypothetical protein
MRFVWVVYRDAIRWWNLRARGRHGWAGPPILCPSLTSVNRNAPAGSTVFLWVDDHITNRKLRR